jgi:hypothetical protein
MRAAFNSANDLIKNEEARVMKTSGIEFRSVGSFAGGAELTRGGLSFAE